ncbi:MAG: glycogen-binding domain-containing protein, partial [Bacteroidales bacterium]
MKKQTQFSVHGLLVLLLTSILLISSCRSTKEKVSADPVIHQAVWLDWGNYAIYYGDYLPPGISHPDSVFLGGQQVMMNKANCYILDRTPEDAPPLIVMNLFINGKSIDVPLKKSGKERVVYSFDPGNMKYTSVSLKGEFNGWTPSATPLEFFEGKWHTVLVLQRGNFQYLLVADGKEMLDPGCEKTVDNNMGGINSLLTVGDQQTERLPAIITKSHTQKDITLTATNGPVELKVFWNNKCLDDEWVAMNGDAITIRIPKEAKKLNRSFIRVFGWNEYGMSNDLLIPLEEGKVVTDPEKLKRQDLHTAIMYNVFV